MHCPCMAPPPYVLGKLVDDVGVNRAPEYSLIPLDYKALAYAVVRVDHDGRHLVSVSNKVSVVEEIQAANQTLAELALC